MHVCIIVFALFYVGMSRLVETVPFDSESSVVNLLCHSFPFLLYCNVFVCVAFLSFFLK